MPNSCARILTCGWLLLSVTSLSAENWPAWRGPSGNSVSTETNLPLKWSEGAANVQKIPIPEWGTSTPAIWDDVVFVTSEQNGRLLLLKIDARNGKTLWTKEVGQGEAVREGQGKRSSKFHRLHNLASPSPVTDGERVIVHFGNGLLASYQFDGEREWSRNLTEDFGPYTIWWGHANSPVLHQNLVISVCMQDPLDGVQKDLALSYLVAHDKATGKVVWKSRRMTGAHAEEGDAYTTPVFYDTDEGTQMIVMGGNQLDAYDPASGRQLWNLKNGLVGGRTITGPTLAGDRVYATVGMRGPLHAVSLRSGENDASSVNVEWKEGRSTPDSCCPVVVNGLLFMVADNGIASCLDAETGKLHWRERLKGKNYKASPLAADGKIYFLSHEGTCTVTLAKKEFKVLAENKLEDEFAASPAVSDGKIFLRGKSALYGISK